MSEAASLLPSVLIALALTALPASAAMLCCAHQGLRQVPLLLAVGIAASGLAAMLSFWAYYADPLIGETFAYLVVFGSIVLTVWSLSTGKLGRDLLAALATPLALWALGSCFLVFLGFLHGGTSEPLGMSATRFSHPLPTDDVIPRFFADWFSLHGHSGTPPLFPPDWLSSDRPPLQIGYVLSQRAFGWDPATDVHYEVLGVVLQQLWIVGLWGVLVAAGLGRVTRGLAMVVVLLSDVTIVNGFYVWPKLLPAAFLLIAVAVVLSPQWPVLRRDLRVAALLAVLLALAMLGHGSSIFGVIPLLAIVAVRGLPSLRWIGVAIVAGLVVFAPWSAYQRYADPPGDRLLKWQLAGVMEIEGRGTLEAIVDSYREAGWSGTLENKLDNFGEMAGIPRAGNETREAVDYIEAGQIGDALRHFRGLRFFSLLPLLGLWLIAPFAMLLARHRAARDGPEWRFALLCFAFTAISCLAWGLLLFGSDPGRTVLHVGSYAVPILALCGCLAGLRASFPRFAVGFAAFNALLVLAAYVPALDPLPGTSYSPTAVAIVALSLAGFVFVVFRGTRASPAPDVLPPAPVATAPPQSAAQRG